MELADFIFKPIGFEHKFKSDRDRADFLSNKYQTATLFCPTCKSERIFTAIHYADALGVAMVYSTTEQRIASDSAIKRVKFICGCAQSWVEIFLETMADSRLVKVGQYPDMIDFDKNVNGDVVKAASKVEQSYRLSAARAYYSGLYIAAFNYLRRVFESLVKQAEVQSSIKKPKQRMKDRVNDLVGAGVLNSLLLESGFNVLYALLSKGVHELNEAECQEQYGFLQEAIDTILEDKLQEQLRQKRKERISKSLAALHSGNSPKS